MFGYVLPCKMELKMKDYEIFRSYYCGLCVAIKNSFGELPRLVLNYDMTFLAILLDSLNNDKRNIINNACIMHPIKKRTKIINNEAINYAAFSNVILAYYKLMDDVEDDKSLKSSFFSSILKPYIKRNKNDYEEVIENIKTNLNKLSLMEKENFSDNIDEISHPFADITGLIISYYYKNEEFSENLYWLGYNLGKWIYIIDAWDDLKDDLEKGKYNPINAVFNKKDLNFNKFSEEIYLRIEDLLLSCGYNCTVNLKKLPLKKNIDLLDNILHLGLIEKMDNVLKRSEDHNGKSL
ncbi:DUF5685 family protein [Oceanirhabdus sp. W0125-5]|uniref:DUF5685 family protein n=1 Tax=Oceanirhabdus sp. W0125-5 TaxID=2999116 RepID=UPI0022F32ABA|nr:DUF5685 family protein [Oceanirhabdus sp. W0125-5]WBW98776.1 DUF5685 family protein [Oceanirhabdus sp. W0125-5]